MRRALAVGTLAWALAAPALALEVGQAAPALDVPGVDGAPIRLADLRGRVVYVDFWASWCPPCRAAIPEYEKLWRELAPRGLTVVGVNIDSEREAALRALKASAITFPIGLDPGGVWPERFRLPTMPTAYLIDRQGVVRYVQKGFSPDEVPQLKARIEAALKEGT